MIVMEMLLKRHHLQYKIAASGEHVCGIKDATVCLKCPTLLLPAVLVKLLEVISPLEIELVRVLIVAVHFNIVKEHVPRHIFRRQVSAPSMESGRPEVHFQVLGLMHELYCFVFIGVEISYLVIVHEESDIVRRPLDCIGVPVIADRGTFHISMVLNLVVAVTINGIGR